MTQSNWFERRYDIQRQIGQGGMGTVHIAYDRLLQMTVALKQVRSQYDLTIEDTEDTYNFALAQEFQVLASLRHPNIIRVLDFGFDSNLVPYFAMDYLEEARDIVSVARWCDHQQKIDLVIQLLNALVYLHRRGILHRDLKPNNVMVTADMQVQVLDFGLAKARDAMTHSVDDPIEGTLAYLAPEILADGVHTPASDLYAVGIIMYEMFMGKHPFDLEDINGLLNSIITEMPSFEDSPEPLPEVISLVINRLMSKDPADRDQDATSVLRILTHETGMTRSKDDEDSRESFLQAASFVGREREMQLLATYLEHAIDYSGQVMLLAGAIGIGKSRLLNEVRIRALVKGMAVFVGQAVVSGGQPFQIWRDILRRLIFMTDVDEVELGILKMITPDIASLLGREIETVEDHDPANAQNRLLAAVENLFKRQTQPMLILLEDIQWASAESLILLRRLSLIASSLPLLIIASYRDDEAPELKTTFGDLRQITLEKLSPEAIEDLSASMIGETGRSAVISDLLRQHTEGNAFWLIEIVRTLAEEAGSLDEIGNITIPQSILQGGMQHVIARRLGFVSDESREWLNVAALLGRSFDLDVLAHVVHTDNLQDWLIACSDAAILDVYDDQWRFSHDHLREYIVDNLSKDDHQQIHQQIAESIETIRDDVDVYAAELAHHWQQAKNEERELHYASIAGQQSLNRGAYAEAINYLLRALELLERRGDDERQRGFIYRQLGDAYISVGQLSNSRQHFEQCIQILDRSVTHRTPLLLSRIAGGAIRQMLHRMLSPIFVARVQDEQSQQTIRELSRAYDQLAEIYYHANMSFDTLATGIKALNLAESIQPTTQLARSYVTMAIVIGTLSLDGISEHYIRMGEQVANTVNDPHAKIYVAMGSGVYRVGAAKWNAVEATVPPAIQLANETKEFRLRGQCLVLLANMQFWRGQFESAYETYTTLYESGIYTDDIQQQGWALSGLGQSALIRGELEKALEYFHQALDLYQHLTDFAMETRVSGLLARTYMLVGQRGKALEFANKTMGLITAQFIPSASEMLEGYSVIPEVAIALYESVTPDSTDAQDHLKLAKKACINLNKYARIYPIGKPAAKRCQGVLAWYSGNQNKAEKLWDESIQAAEKIDMRYEKALTLMTMTKYLEHVSHRDEASQLLNQLGAIHDLAKVE